MKKNLKRFIHFTLCASVLLGIMPTSACSDKDALSGTALAEALLAKERINHEHLSQSFDFLDNRLHESDVQPTAKDVKSSKNAVQPMAAYTNASENNDKGEIISGSGDNAVYSWSHFTQLVKELHYFQSHFSEGQTRTDNVEENITFLENHTDIKNKWVQGISYIDYLMQVDEDREIIYANDTYNENYSVGIRSVNDEINTTYEFYENQGDLYLRTLATPNRRYEYSTVSGNEVMAFVADNDNGYWRLTQMYSPRGEDVSLNVIIMTDDLAYSFRYNISQSSMYSSEITLLSPDLKYEIAYLNGSEITIFPGSFTGINSLRISQEEQAALGDYGSKVGYTSDYGYYSSNAAPHVYTDKGVWKAPIPYAAESGGTTTIPTTLDENVDYVDGNVRGLWEMVYPQLDFEVKGETVIERLDNLHAALAKYGVEPVYDKTKVGKMATDVLKLAEEYSAHYTWNGELLSTNENAIRAYQTEKAKSAYFENLFTEAKKLPSITENEFLEIQQNAGFPSLSFQSEATVSVNNGKITLNGLAASVAENSVLEQNQNYVLKLALKKNTDTLEELVVLDNQNQDALTAYTEGNLALSLSGEFHLPTDVAAGEYDVVAYAATADGGIRVSKFQRVLCAGTVNDQVTLNTLKLHTIITPEKVLRATYEQIFDASITLTQGEEPYRYTQVLQMIESEIMDKGYFLTDAKLEVLDTQTNTFVPVETDTISIGVYRLAYLGQADGGKVAAYIYCTIK